MMKNLKLLLVDDNVLNQKLIIINLSRFGYIIDVANNGQEAFDKVSLNFYDLILMDLMMPVMDGYEATVKIREYEKKNNRYTPIIGLTANTYDQDRNKCLAIGMDDFMTKPFDLHIFQLALRNLGFL